MVTLEVPAESSEPHPTPAPARSVRRATARRASTRRASARSRQSDGEASILDFVTKHPRSTIGDLAKALNRDLEHVATDLTKLARAGEIQKSSHGYSARRPTRPPG